MCNEAENRLEAFEQEVRARLGLLPGEEQGLAERLYQTDEEKLEAKPLGHVAADLVIRGIVGHGIDGLGRLLEEQRGEPGETAVIKAAVACADIFRELLTVTEEVVREAEEDLEELEELDEQ